MLGRSYSSLKRLSDAKSSSKVSVKPKICSFSSSRLLASKPQKSSSFLAQIWTSSHSLQRLHLLSLATLRHTTKAILSNYGESSARCLSTDSKSSNQSSTHSSALAALSAQIHELVATENYAYAQQLLKQAQLPFSTYPLPLLKDVLKVFLATQEYKSACDCGVLIFRLENASSDTSLLNFLVEYHLKTDMPIKALKGILENKLKSLLIKHGGYVYGQVIEKSMSIAESFAFIASLEDKTEAIGILKLFATTHSVLNCPAAVIAAAHAILSIDPNHDFAAMTLWSAHVCQANAEANTRRAFVQDTLQVAGPSLDRIQFNFEAGLLDGKFQEMLVLSEELFSNQRDMAVPFAPWHITAVMKLHGHQKAQEKLAEYSLESMEQLFNEHHSFLGKVRILHYLLEHDLPLMERLLYDHVLKEGSLNLSKCQILFGLSIRLAAGTDLTARIRFLEALANASQYPNLFAIKNLADAYFEKQDPKSAYHYLKLLPCFIPLTASERYKMAVCAETLGEQSDPELLVKALELYRSYDEEPHKFDAKVRVATLLLKLERYDEAMTAYEEAMKLRQPVHFANISLDAEWSSFFVGEWEEYSSSGKSTPPQYINHEKAIYHARELIKICANAPALEPLHSVGTSRLAKCLKALGRSE